MLVELLTIGEMENRSCYCFLGILRNILGPTLQEMFLYYTKPNHCKTILPCKRKLKQKMWGGPWPFWQFFPINFTTSLILIAHKILLLIYAYWATIMASIICVLLLNLSDYNYSFKFQIHHFQLDTSDIHMYMWQTSQILTYSNINLWPSSPIVMTLSVSYSLVSCVINYLITHNTNLRIILSSI